MTARKKRTSAAQTLGPFWRHYFVDRRRIAASVLAGLFASALAAATPWPVKFVIDGVLLKSASPIAALATLSAYEQVAIFAIASFALGAAAAIASAAEKMLNARIREGMTNRLRVAIVDNIIARPFDALRAFKVGDLALRVIDDAGQVARLYCKTGPTIFRHVATTVFTLVAMTLVNPLLGLIGAGILLALSIIARAGAASLQRASRQKRAHEGRISAYVMELFRNQRFVRAVGGEDRVRAIFERRNHDGVAAGVLESRAAVKLERTMQLANGAAVAIIIAAGAFLALRGAMSVGDLTIAMAYLAQLLKPIEKINELASAVTGALTRAERLSDFLAAPARIAPSAARAHGALSLDRVSFSHIDAPERRILDSARFSITARESVWIKGASGVGKSTLIDLLLRLREPQSGAIAIDGKLADDWPVADWRAQFAVMLQEHFMFSGALREIVAFAVGDVADERVRDALDRAALGDLPASLPEGLASLIDEAGANLSGGQRARLCLARAIACDRPFLVLDEPLANVDADTKGKIIATLRAEKGRRTMLIVSHDELPSDLYDRRLELLGGRLVEREQAPNVVDFTIRS